MWMRLTTYNFNVRTNHFHTDTIRERVFVNDLALIEELIDFKSGKSMPSS